MTRSPRISHRRFTAGAGPDFVEGFEGVFAEGDVQRGQGGGELLHGAGADDRGGDDVVAQQPGQREFGGEVEKEIAWARSHLGQTQRQPAPKASCAT